MGLSNIGEQPADHDDLSGLSRANFLKIAAGFGMAIVGAESLIDVAKAATEVDISKYPILPPGVKETTHPAREAAHALNHFDQHPVVWKGLIVLLPPRGKARAGFTMSPTSSLTINVNEENAETSPVQKWEKPENVLLPYAETPGLMMFKNRLYAVTYDDDSQTFGFLDIAWAHHNGAIGLLEYPHLKPGPMHGTNHYGVEQVPADLFTLQEWHYIKKHGSIYIDNQNPRKVRLSHTFPHL